jgi:hypothetical protein
VDVLVIGPVVAEAQSRGAGFLSGDEPAVLVTIRCALRIIDQADLLCFHE